MKKNLLLIGLLAPMFCLAQLQEFVITPYGLRGNADTSKSYIVLNVKDRTSKQLYDATLKYINETYKNPDLVIKAKTDSEYIRMETFTPFIAKVKLAGGFGIPTTYSISSKYSVEMHFKEGKVKYEIISMDLKTNTNFEFSLVKRKGILADNLFLYTRDLEIKHDDTRKQIEQYYNDEVVKYYAYFTQNKNDW